LSAPIVFASIAAWRPEDACDAQTQRGKRRHFGQRRACAAAGSRRRTGL